MTDPADDPIAYTYEDAARLCGVSTETIRLRARRGKLRKGRLTNTNRPTVLMTAAGIEAISAGKPLSGRPDGQIPRPDSQPSGQMSRPNGQNSEIKALTDRLATLLEGLDRDQAQIDGLLKDLERERGRVSAAERRATEERAERVAVFVKIDALAHELDATKEELKAVRMERDRLLLPDAAQPKPGWLRRAFSRKG
jgi:hypothetical protein